MGKSILKRLLHRLISKRKKATAVPVYISRFNTIEKMISGNLIGIDLAENYVVLDISIHIRYMNDSKEYATFFDTLRAYINYKKGYLQMPMETPSDRINFAAVLKDEKRFDIDTGDFFDKPQEKIIPWIIGYYQNGILYYDVYEDNTGQN